MAWKECDRVSFRQEFVALASGEGACMTTLCQRFGISRKTGYKWLTRYRDGQGDAKALADRSRRPQRFRSPTSSEAENQVLEARDLHPSWAGRKLHHWLKRQGVLEIPAPSTITAILRRHGRLTAGVAAPRSFRDWIRFEHPAPNDLWQMDFKGEFALAGGGLCYPLTVLDDHSRFSMTIHACGNQQRMTVQNALTEVFRRYGLPRRMLMDNGAPWGVSNTPGAYTRLTVWLLRLGVRVTHGNIYHPQTQGKEERFHRTLKLEVISRGPLDNLQHAQRRFDHWRAIYNQERPHEALGMDVPASRYRVSDRAFPELLPPIEYAADLVVRRTNAVGQFSFQGRKWKISEAFGKEPIGLRATTEDGVWEIHYSGHTIGKIDVNTVKHGDESKTFADQRPRPEIGEAALENHRPIVQGPS
jgi:transposase InsO family protein